ncbi:MAG: hypothetical protein HKO05_11940 [Erythrobacter sp.]|jgi:hypothetical protein|nr:hypothetical protein [Erythrobacter sp.]RZV33850.1 MAG: hypothetical protein EX262_05925 [Sphingomonadaceae bacterium]
MSENTRDASQAADDQADADGDKSPVPPTWIGWSLRVASTLLIAALLVYLTIQAVSPPQDFRLAIEAEWDKASSRDGELLVPIKLTNDSTQTVRNLRVDLMSDLPEPVEVEILLFGPGENVTYVIPLKERGEVSHRVLSFEQ